MCVHGETVMLEVTIPASLSHSGERVRKCKPIDRCIAPLVAALNASGVVTIGACCGHGRNDGEILLEDGRTLVVKAPRVSGV